jgi:hypothetical protein
VTGRTRVRHRTLQTPVVRFVHPKSGRRVTVIATVHIGPAVYYGQLRTMIKEMESAGAVVCYEGPGPAPKQEWVAASDEERAALDGEQRMLPEFSKAAGRYFGWVDQWTALGGSPSWRYEQGSSLAYVRRAGTQELLSRQRGFGTPFMGLTQDQQDAFMGGLYAVAVRLEQFGWFALLRHLLARLVGGAARTDDVVADERTRHVLASLPADSDAVLPWGADHLPGLAAGLRKAGYRRRETTWVTVGRLPAIWPSVKAFWAGIKALWRAPGAGDDETSPPSSPDSAA